MAHSRILFVLTMILLSAPVSGLAGTPSPEGVQNCITWHKNFYDTVDAMCKVLKCKGPSTRPSDADLKQSCVCEDGMLQERLSPDDYNLYQKVITAKSDPLNNEEDARYKKNIGPVVDQADKQCGLQ
jgi:hypothetical protein